MSPVVDTKAESVPCHLFRANSERWTFACDNVRAWVEERLDGRVLNACAGETRLRHDKEVIRNDINEDRPADYHVDLRELPGVLTSRQFDTVVYDPPWSVFQVNDKYEGRGQDTIKQSTQMARAIDKLLTSGGQVIAFGYTINMMPSSFGYDLDEVAIFTIPGPGRDFFGSVHRDRRRKLGEWST